MPRDIVTDRRPPDGAIHGESVVRSVGVALRDGDKRDREWRFVDDDKVDGDEPEYAPCRSAHGPQDALAQLCIRGRTGSAPLALHRRGDERSDATSTGTNAGPLQRLLDVSRK